MDELKERYLLKFIYDNDLINEYLNFFTTEPIKSIYDFIINFNKDNNDLPTIDDIIGNGFKDDIIRVIFKDFPTNYNDDYFENMLKVRYKEFTIDNGLLKMIELKRSGNIDILKNELIKIIDIIDDNEIIIDSNYEDNLSTPYLGKYVYDSMDGELKNTIDQFSNYHHKDIIILSYLTIFSSLMFDKTIFFYNDKDPVQFNLFISGPSGSGKGLMSSIFKTFSPIINKINEKIEVDNEDKFRLVIPLDTSTAALGYQLKINKGRGLIFSTESKILSQNKINSWGDITEIILKGYHGENIDILRKTDTIQINDPSFSVLVSGTNDQLLNFIESSQDGLFSRFLYYIYDIQDTPTIKSTVHDNDYLNKLTEYTTKLIDKINGDLFGLELNIKLSKKNLDNYNECFIKDWELNKDIKNIRGILQRLYNSGQRIMGILELMKNGKNDLFNKTELIISDEIYEVGKYIINVLKHHTLVYKSNINEEMKIITDKQYSYMILLDNMGDTFSIQDAYDYGLKNNKNKGQIKKYLNTLKSKKLVKNINRGIYQKKIKNNEGNKN